MASSSAQSTPAHSHPLSQDEVPSRGRRSRGKQSEDSPRQTRPQTDYFTLKAQLDSAAEEHTKNFRSNWDGSVRGYGKGSRRSVQPLVVCHCQAWLLMADQSASSGRPSSLPSSL